MNTNLYELTTGFNNIMELVLDETIDLDVLENALKTIEADLDTKVDNGICLIRDLQALQKSRKEEADRLDAQAKFLENRIKRIQDWYKVNLEFIGKDKVQTTHGTMSVRKNPMSLKIDNDKLIPAEYMTVIPEHYEPNKNAIKEAIKSGKNVAGCHLEQGTNLRIS